MYMYIQLVNSLYSLYANKILIYFPASIFSHSTYEYIDVLNNALHDWLFPHHCSSHKKLVAIVTECIVQFN